jgi:hypothetical protein
MTSLVYIGILIAGLAWFAVEYLIKDASKRPTVLLLFGAAVAFVAGQYFHQTPEQCAFLFMAAQAGGNLDGLIQTIPGLSRLKRSVVAKPIPAPPPPSN